MSEHKYAFLKNNRVMNVVIFDAKNDADAEFHKNEYDYDEFIYCENGVAPSMYSVKEKNGFVEADKDFLFSIGLSPYDNATFAEWQAKNADES